MNQDRDTQRSLWIIVAILAVLGTALCSAIVLIGISLTSDGATFDKLPAINFTPDVLFNLMFILFLTLPPIFIVFTIYRRISNAAQTIQQKTGHSMMEILQVLRSQNFTNPNDAYQFLKTRFNLSEEDVRVIIAALGNRAENSSPAQPAATTGTAPARQRTLGCVALFILLDLLIFGGILAVWLLSR